MIINALFTPSDLKQIKDRGLTMQAVEKQLAIYAKGPSYLSLNRPCTLGDGIFAFSSAQRKKLIQRFDAEACAYQMLKFVPASGAASRMFAHWYAAAREGGFGSEKADKTFYRNLKKLPLTPLIAKNHKAIIHLRGKNTSGLLDYILSDKGLHYGWLPKALIHFHAYPKGEIRTALEEHLVEAARLTSDKGGKSHLHFTLSEEHINHVMDKLKKVRKKYESRYHVRLQVDHSIQSPSTDVLAVNEDKTPFRDEEGRIVFRPGGHGALLKNLEALEADFIFVKNIDNIVPDNVLNRILPYKKMLGGLALQIQQTIFAMLQDMDEGGLARDRMNEYAGFCLGQLNVVLPSDFERMSLLRQKEKLFSILHRPLRVCGVVKNEGEPGGGPFWVQEKGGMSSLQIVESAHVDPRNKKQQDIWRHSVYFNPVDMVCCIRNYRGKKFDLEKFVNRDAYLISRKTEKGRKLLAQELPGLWNGGMAYWNTVFVELPLAVFNPVKTVEDLLRPEHIAGNRIRQKPRISQGDNQRIRFSQSSFDAA